MTKRMQVLFEDEEFRRLQAAARTKGQTLAEWVRGALRDVMRETPTADPQRKLKAVRLASRHSYPTAEIDRMLDEIESGYFR